MRIVIDMQGAQTESRFRGIGRYTLSFAKAVVNNRADHEVFLVLSGLFPETIEPIRDAFKGLLPQEHILVWCAPGPVSERAGSSNVFRREVAELLREAFIATLQPDVVHLTSLFEGYVDDAITSIALFDTATPTSTILYDLIPLQNPKQYLEPDQQYAEYYRRKIEHLDNASLYLTISEFSRSEGIEVLDQPSEKFINISTAADEHFRVTNVTKEKSKALLEHFEVSRPFVLYVGGTDDRKNLPRLIEAYAKLDFELRSTHQLLFAGRMLPLDEERFKEIGRSFGLGDDELLFTGYIGEEELVQLYSLCKLYVFPSWHEGFGLPALEAMACGATVIAGDKSSLPEVVGLPEALFDPLSVLSITHKMQQALTDVAFRAGLREHGLEQAKKFSWVATAVRAVRAWEDLVVNVPNRMMPWRQTRACLSTIHTRLIKSVAKILGKHGLRSEAMLKDIAFDIYKNEAEAEKLLRARALQDNITWRIEGPFDSSYSLALVNREIARALQALGHDVLLHSTEGPGDFPPNPRFLSDNTDLELMYQRAQQVEHVDCDVVSRNLYPPRVSDMTARMNFLHAYGWEESGFPMEWVDQFNDALQGMTVMSEHVRKVMLDHGVTVPIEVCKLGTEHWDRVILDPAYELTARKFRFLHVSSCFPRKGVDVMLRAYGQAFSDADDVTLVIKTFKNPHNEVHDWLAKARHDNPTYPHVLIIEEDLTDGGLKSLYSQCHVLVAPSRAEGFGLPMAEAMLSGLAVIVTNWSGQTDFCNDETAWLVDYEFQPAQTHFGLPSSVWAEPDESHLAGRMREVYETPEPMRLQRVAAGEELLRGSFTWREVANRMVSAAKNCSLSQRVETPRIGWISTWNTKCGIATYSEHLVKNMPADICVLAAYDQSYTTQDVGNVIRCWAPGESDDLCELADAIAENDINVVVIQFNYGFFNFENLAHLIDQQVDAGRLVIIALHATQDPEHVPHKKLIQIRDALIRCDRVLVHSYHDMNRLKKLGVIANVTLFPHGIVDYFAPEKPLAPGNLIKLKTYGFFLPHKGLSEMVDVVASLKKMGFEVHLEMVNAEYPAIQSSMEIEQVRSKVKRLGLENEIELCTDFLSDEESLGKLAQADLIVFPYQGTGESSSAAVRYGVASGRPVATTPLQIFEDIAPAVHKLPGVQPEQMAKGISEVVEGLSLGAAEVLKVEEKARVWRNVNSYQRIALRMYNQLSAIVAGKSAQV